MSYAGQIIKLTLPGAATKVETLLNSISTRLYNDAVITQEYIFDISVEEAKYLRNTANISSNKVYGLIHLNDRRFYSEDYTNYDEFHTINICTLWKNLNDINKILADYQAFESDYNKVEHITIDGDRFNINKISTSYNVLPRDNPNDGTNQDKAYFYILSTWNIMSGIADSEDIQVQIDGIDIPQMSLSHQLNKLILSSKDRTALGFTQNIPSSTLDSISLVLPYIPTHTKLNELFLDSRSRTLLSKRYHLKVIVSGNTIVNDNYYISSSSFSDDKPAPLIFGITLSLDFPTQKVMIKKAEEGDDSYQEMILYSHNITKTINSDKTPILNRDADNTKSIPISYIRNISMSIPIIKGSFTDNLEISLYGDAVDLLYDIKLIKIYNSTPLEFVYNVNIADISLDTTVNADGTLIVIFEEREDDI